MRFFVQPDDVIDGTIRLSKEDSDHIRSLRIRPDEYFIVCDGCGVDYVCRLGERYGNTIVEITGQNPSSGEPSVKCRVYIAYSKGDRLDYSVQKSVELGAGEIILYESERCVAVPRDIPKKISRLQRIAFETAKQSGRGIVPVVKAIGNFETATSDAIKDSMLSLLFYENENQLGIKEVLERYFCQQNGDEVKDIKSVSLITGPEGGFAPLEVESAQIKGIKIVSLGPRILRSETAPIVALTAVMFHTENLAHRIR